MGWIWADKIDFLVWYLGIKFLEALLVLENGLGKGEENQKENYFPSYLHPQFKRMWQIDFHM